MKKKNITPPFWIHILGVLVWITLFILLAAINIILYTGIRISFGLLGLILALIISSQEFKKAAKNNKNPYSAYFLSELYLFLLIAIFGTIYAYFGFLIAVISFIIFMSVLIWIVILYEKKSKIKTKHV